MWEVRSTHQPEVVVGNFHGFLREIRSGHGAFFMIFKNIIQSLTERDL